MMAQGATPYLDLWILRQRLPVIHRLDDHMSAAPSPIESELRRLSNARVEQEGVECHRGDGFLFFNFRGKAGGACCRD